MLLSELKKGACAEITKVLTEDNALKERLNALGLMRGESIIIKSFSLGRRTIKLEINNTSLIALRMKEAKNIEVKEIQ